MSQPHRMFQRLERSFEVPTGANKHLEIRQEVLRGQRNIAVTGQVVVQRAQASNHPYGRNGCLFLSVRVNNQGLSVTPDWNKDHGLLVLRPPSAASGLHGTLLIDIVIIASFPEDTTLQNISIKVRNLSLQISQNATITVLEFSQFATRSGSISFRKDPGPSASNTSSPGGKFNSCEIYVETASGSIKGNFPLHHHLNIRSTSGEISAHVDPQPFSPIASLAAYLTVQTEDGNIYLQTDSPLPRDYITNIQSTTGRIDGKFYLGSQLFFRTTRGNLKNLVILPIVLVNHPPKTIEFTTRTETGKTNITMLKPMFFAQESHLLNQNQNKLQNLSSLHSSTTGYISLNYPLEWEGYVHALTGGSGRVSNICDYGLETIDSQRGQEGQQVECKARRGVREESEGSIVRMKSQRGYLMFAYIPEDA